MNKMKKTAAVLLMLTAALALAACGDSETGGGSSAAETTAVQETAAETTGTESETAAETTASESETTASGAAAATDAPETTTAATAAKTASGEAMSEQDLEFYARRHYGRRTNYSPEYVAVERKEDGTAVIQLYDSFSDHNATCDWYTVDQITGKGTNLLGDEISIKDDDYPVWYPEDTYYNTGKLAFVLYIGKMDKSTDLNPTSLQKLIDNTTGAREYVNHYPYVSEIPAHNMISTEGGEDVFMVIPSDKEAQIRIDTVAQGEEDGRCLFRSYCGQPVIIRGNALGQNDFSVTVTDNAGKHPYFSMWYAEAKGEVQFLGGDQLELLNFPFD